MKFSLSCLKEYLETNLQTKQICESLTNIGLEVESCEDKSRAYLTFSVAKIIETRQHENSDKLRVCQVEVDDGKILQIICGAANARAGIKVAYASIGSVIPGNGMVIKLAKIAGIESHGMLCSAGELQIDGDNSGIIEIDDKWPVGTNISEPLGLDEVTIEINVTPNRGDCLGIYGIARDLAASGIGKLKKLEIAKAKSQSPFPLKITNEASESCPLAAFRYIKNIKNCDSPEWLRKKLSAFGIGSISAIVDVTNYVMMILNRPMHAYDASKINSSITIRFSRQEEKFLSLRGDEISLNKKTLLIADEKIPLGIAGIIGSKDSLCSLTTSEIILEAAVFDASIITSTGREIGIASDSRYRFERGVDEKTCESGIELATKLILEICGGEVSEIKIIGEKSAAKKIEFNLEKIKSLTAVEVEPERVLSILSDLEFEVKKSDNGNLLVEVPTHRHDIFLEEDLVEEVIRIVGYNKIAKEELPKSKKIKFHNQLRRVRDCLVLSGITEVINWSFCSSNLVEIFSEKNENLTLKNPINSEMDHMRPTLMIGLIESYKRNSLRSFTDLSFFEIGNVFTPDQRMMISGIRVGKNKPQNHYHDERDFDVFDVKKDVFDVIKTYGMNPESIQISSNEAPKYYHPHRSAVLKLGKNIIGYFGEIHPSITKKFDLSIRINAFEIFSENIPYANKPEAKSATRKPFIVSDFQAVERDFAFVIDKDLAIGEIVKTITNSDKQMIKEVRVFDIFTGKNITEDKKSVALRIKIQSFEKTLTSEEIEVICQKVVGQVRQSFNATLREF